MADDRLSASLQESTLTLLAFSDEEGAVAAGMLSANVFDDPYRDVAQRVLTFRRMHNRPPGEAHIDDIFDDILSNPGHAQHKVFVRILDGMLHQAKGLNAGYVAKRVTDFIRQQDLKLAIHDAAQRFQQGGDSLVDDVEQALLKGLKRRADPMLGGLFLGDADRALRFMTHPRVAIKTGITQFDRVNAGPEPGKIVIFMAPKGRGKTWACTHVGKRAMLQGERVMHISLEMDEDELAQRYLQAFFAVAKRREQFHRTIINTDSAGRLDSFDFEKMLPQLAYSDPKIENILRREMRKWGARLDQLHIKAFPSGSLTLGKLNAYLDYCENVYKFIPTVLIVDYPDLMSIDSSNKRDSLGATIVGLRGICGERNLAGFLPSQSNRLSTEVGTVSESHVAEDFSKLQTADKVWIYSQTKAEKGLSLARLYLDKNRGDQDNITIMAAQSYTTGQFILGDTFRMGMNYFDLVKQTPPPERADPE